jgi:hypothetical protein
MNPRTCFCFSYTCQLNTNHIVFLLVQCILYFMVLDRQQIKSVLYQYNGLVIINDKLSLLGGAQLISWILNVLLALFFIFTFTPALVGGQC